MVPGDEEGTSVASEDGDELERCAVCAFAWDLVGPEEVGPRIVAGAHGLAQALRAHPGAATRRPAPERWSALEYAAHLRDVLLHVRDRLIIALVEDDPEFTPLYPDRRVDLGLYAVDDVATVGTELEVAAGLFSRTFQQIDEAALRRKGHYLYPTTALRSLTWMAAQVVHEVEHHRDDVDEVLAAVG